MPAPLTMKTMHVTGAAGGPVLAEGELSRPQPADTDLLVRVFAAGVTPSELLWYTTSHTVTGDPRLAAIPGHEFSGVIADLGSQGTGWKIGDAVFGMNDWFAEGATAEYCLASPTAVAAKPAGISHAEAATVPIAALTAQQGLFDHAVLKAGERVLIHGGAGAVGLFAVQMAAQQGAHVVTTVSAHNHDFVLSLGAQQAIHYRETQFEEQSGKVDVVFDTVGGETLERSWSVLKSGGRVVTVAASSEHAAGKVRDAFFIVEPNAKQLAAIAERLAAGTLKAIVDSVFPLSQAADVYAEQVSRNGRGKVVLEIAAEEV